MTDPARSRRPLARRIRFALLGVGFVCVVVSATLFYVLWSQQTLALRIAQLERQVGVVASGVAVSDVLPGSPSDVNAARERLMKVEAGLLGVRLSVADASGTVLYSTAGVSAAKSYPVRSLKAASASPFGARSGVLAVPDVGRVAVVAVPVKFDAPNHPVRYLIGAEALSDMRAGDSWVAAAIALGALVGLAAAWILGGLLTRRITAPLVRLTEGARAISRGEWGRQVPIEGDDEVSDLAVAFNEMSERVATTYEAQTEFVADVSHELRTPIASIRGFADAIAEGVTNDEASTRRAAVIISNEAENLAELTSTLLALADLDSGAVTLEATPVSALSLAASLHDRFDARADAEGIGLEITAEQGGPLGDPARVLQALSVLADNALAYTPGGGRVRIRMGSADGAWQAEVADSGPGIPAEDLERVFGRFTRLDQSRSAQSGGSGLGLAICRRLVALMGGRVWAESSSQLGGARFIIELPFAR